jgi:nicotinamidase/pyrazinamidase
MVRDRYYHSKYVIGTNKESDMKIPNCMIEQRKTLKRKVASVEVDVMKTFSQLCMDELPVKDALDIVAPINALANKVTFRIGSKDAHSENAEWITDKDEEIGSPTGNPQAPHKWKKHGIPGTLGFEMLDGMPDPFSYDFFVWKGIESRYHPYGVCYHDPLNTMSTGLIEWLLINEVTEVVVSGLAYDHCVKETVLELARTKLFKVIVIRECSKGIDPDDYHNVEKKFIDNGVEILDTVEQFISDSVEVLDTVTEFAE